MKSARSSLPLKRRAQRLCSPGVFVTFLLAKVDKHKFASTFIHIFVTIYDEQKAGLCEQKGRFKLERHFVSSNPVNHWLCDKSLNTRHNIDDLLKQAVFQ